jgi:hypothetical protein
MNAEQVMFALDDDDIITDLDQTPWVASAPKRDSFIGALLGESVAREGDTLVASLTRLEKTCEAFDSSDPSATAAELSLRRKVGTLSLLCAALGNVRAFAQRPEHHELFAHRGLLDAYLSNVHMWTGDITETLESLATELNALAPDWSAFRECVLNVDWIYARAMTEQRRLDHVADTLPEDLRVALDDLFITLPRLMHALDEPFG